MIFTHIFNGMILMILVYFNNNTNHLKSFQWNKILYLKELATPYLIKRKKERGIVFYCVLNYSMLHTKPLLNAQCHLSEFDFLRI
jgi:hypothetical protein